MLDTHLHNLGYEAPLGAVPVREQFNEDVDRLLAKGREFLSKAVDLMDAADADDDGTGIMVNALCAIIDLAGETDPDAVRQAIVDAVAVGGDA